VHAVAIGARRAIDELGRYASLHETGACSLHVVNPHEIDLAAVMQCNELWADPRVVDGG
jgi:hypothetical protein